ncbi:ABC transporter permease [Bacillus sp. JCM 19041]|uniref:ABC transporter permease n=1 Tax=Bacillus sp. JCM 19041 TaxID=1460637 RepID=UPI0006D07EA8
MRAIFYQYGKEVIREPFTLLLMLGMTIFFAFIIGGSSEQNVFVYSTEMDDSELSSYIEQWNEAEELNFMVTTETEAKRKISTHEVEVILEAGRSDYRLHVAYEGSPVAAFVGPTIYNYYMQQQLEDRVDDHGETQAAYAYQSDVMVEGSEYDQSLQSLFGFTLYFAFFTISFSIMSILQQKEAGTWNRIILSPTSKTEMYTGNLLFSFLLAYVQIALVLTLFVMLFDYDYYGGFWKLLLVIIPYVFAIMAFGIFLSGIVTASQQLNGVIPLFATSFAMLGGAFWPLDIVQSDFLLGMSYISPIMYGIEMMMGATVNNWELQQFFLPAAVLLFMGLALTGIGIRLMERKSV